jgi:hypothetical protein
MAVVFHGIIGGMDGRNGIGVPIDIDICAKTIKHNILSEYDTDVFIHSWSIEHKDSVESLYNPVMSIFEPQEMFGHSFDGSALQNEHATILFRTFSKYNSMYRAMQLKQDYENKNNFKYSWVLVLRFDLVVFNKLNLSNFSNNNFYICSEPHWPDINSLQMVHDIVFLSGSELMDTYCGVAKELESVYKERIGEAHRLAYFKLKDMFQGDMNRVGYAFKRYEDMDIYRLIMSVEQNELGQQYGALETKGRLEQLLKKIGE